MGDVIDDRNLHGNLINQSWWQNLQIISCHTCSHHEGEGKSFVKPTSCQLPCARVPKKQQQEQKKYKFSFIFSGRYVYVTARWWQKKVYERMGQADEGESEEGKKLQ